VAVEIKIISEIRKARTEDIIIEEKHAKLAELQRKFETGQLLEEARNKDGRVIRQLMCIKPAPYAIILIIW